MADETLLRDQNHITVLGAVTDNAAQEIRMLRVDPITKRLLISATGGGGGGDIDSINNDANPDQFLTVGTSGTDFNVDDTGGGTHVFNLPSASTVNRGVITTGAQTLGGVKTFDSLPLLPSTVPTLDNQAVTKNYVDLVAQGLTVKESCVAATTANITLADAQTIDGVAVVNPNRVLVKNQSIGANNGIYVVTNSGAWVRASDYNSSAEVAAGTFTAILGGSANANTLWVQTTPDPVLGVSTLSFSQLSTAGTGSVTSVSVVTANGVSGSVANASSTPAITLTLGDITPSSVVSAGVIRPSANDGAALGSAAVSFSDLFLASGAVINWNNGNVGITHNNAGAFILVNPGDLRVTSANVGTNADSVPTLSSISTLTNKTLTSPILTTPSAFTTGGTITLAENTSIALDPAGSADGKYSGITMTGTAGTTLAFGDLIYLAAADSRWELVDADSVTTCGAVFTGMCVLAAAADGSPTTILLKGNIRADANFPALTIGAPVYASTSPGDIQVAQPNGTDDVIQVVGFALTADEIHFSPSNDYITHV